MSRNSTRPIRSRAGARERLDQNAFIQMWEATWRPRRPSPYLHVNAVGKLGEPVPIQISMYDADLTQPDVLVYAWTEAAHIRVCRSIDGRTWTDTLHPCNAASGAGFGSDAARRTILQSCVDRVSAEDHLAYGRELARRNVARRQRDLAVVNHELRELTAEVARRQSDHMRARMLETAWDSESPSARAIACSLVAAGLRCSADELMDTVKSLASDT